MTVCTMPHSRPQFLKQAIVLASLLLQAFLPCCSSLLDQQQSGRQPVGQLSDSHNQYDNVLRR
jgi:hypothetical protein